ncbi:MAG: hypothetical protein ACLQE9_18725 [Roseiarcus sp.]
MSACRFSTAGMGGAPGLDLRSPSVAVVGAMIVPAVYRAVMTGG